MCFVGLQRLEQGLEHGFARVLFGLRIYLPFWYVGCQMRLEHVFILLANQGAYFNSVLNMFY